MDKDQLEELRNEYTRTIYALIVQAEELFYTSVSVEEREFLKTTCDDVRKILLLIHEKIFNDLYIIVKNNFLSETNTQMSKLHNDFISPLCMLNILSRLTTTIHVLLKRDDLDTYSLENYLASINKNFNMMINDFRIARCLVHDCVKEGHSFELPNLPEGVQQFKFVVVE